MRRNRCSILIAYASNAKVISGPNRIAAKLKIDFFSVNPYYGRVYGVYANLNDPGMWYYP
jgi:hypothetical protein